MTAQTSLQAPQFGAALRSRVAAHPVLAVLFASLVIAASARIDVPMIPVHMTMQSYAVLVVGAFMGARLGAAAVLAYLAEGAVGLPVFQGGGAGLAHLVGPTGGYLAGFVLAAFLAGAFIERVARASLLRLAVAMGLAHVLLFVTGVLWLASFVGWEKAVAVGLTPFLLGMVVKVALAVATVRVADGRPAPAI